MKKQSKARIFIGLQEIADVVLRLAQGLRALGYPVTSLVWEIDSPLRRRSSSHDRYIRRSANKYLCQARLLKEFLRHCRQYDIFIFNFCTSFTGYLLRSNNPLCQAAAYMDLALLKMLKKKIVVLVNGDDLRFRPRLVEEMEQAGLGQHAQYARRDLDMTAGGSEAAKRRRAAKIQKYADYIFARPMSAQLLTRNYNLFWLPFDLSLFKTKADYSRPPLVVHAPSDSRVKGTAYVQEAVVRLQSAGYKFDFLLCENMDNSLLREKLAAAQIAIDQLILPGYGSFAVEAMASSCAVLGSAVAGYNGFSQDLPIVTTTPDTVYENLQRLLDDKALRIKLAHAGRRYAQEHHDLIKVTKDFLNQINE